MIQIIETGHADVFSVKVTGTLHEEDYQVLIPAIEEKIAAQGKINLYWEMSDFEGWGPKGIWEDLTFDIKHVNSFEKIALVGEKQWEEWMTKLMKPFTTAQVHYFNYADRDEARTWIGL